MYTLKKTERERDKVLTAKENQPFCFLIYEGHFPLPSLSSQYFILVHHLSWFLGSKLWQQQVEYSPHISLEHQVQVGIQPTFWTWQTCVCWEPFPNKMSYLLIKQSSFYNWNKNELCQPCPTFDGGSWTEVCSLRSQFLGLEHRKP